MSEPSSPIDYEPPQPGRSPRAMVLLGFSGVFFLFALGFAGFGLYALPHYRGRLGVALFIFGIAAGSGYFVAASRWARAGLKLLR